MWPNNHYDDREGKPATMKGEKREWGGKKRDPCKDHTSAGHSCMQENISWTSGVSIHKKVLKNELQIKGAIFYSTAKKGNPAGGWPQELLPRRGRCLKNNRVKAEANAPDRYNRGACWRGTKC